MSVPPLYGVDAANIQIYSKTTIDFPKIIDFRKVELPLSLTFMFSVPKTYILRPKNVRPPMEKRTSFDWRT